MINRAFVLDKNRQPLMPCPRHRAKELLRKGRAAIYRREPFTIILKDREGGALQEIELKTDPGSRTTGIALVAPYQRGNTVIWAGELQHRALAIRKGLEKRRTLRRSRRSRKTRYRPARFDNRTRPLGWLPPSLCSRVDNVYQWAGRLCRWAPVTRIAIETVRFDLQRIVNPEISGVEYQQGELAGYELREYLLEKFARKCIYCGAENVPLEIEHLTPRSRHGSNRASNLGLSCRPCNTAKGNRTAAEFGYSEVQAMALRPLRDAAAVNATRYAIGNALKRLGLPVTFWSGGRTKFNRCQQHYPKAHWIDAACVGDNGDPVHLDPEMKRLEIKALGRGNRQACRVDKYGFPRTQGQAVKRIQGFQTGDQARLYMPKGKYAGHHTGRIVGVRATGILDLKTTTHKIGAPAHRFSLVQHFDGYGYGWRRGR
jgi:5-methylcytosine-specific restriction endonuclease McrA